MINEVALEGIVVREPWKFMDDLFFRLVIYRDSDLPAKKLDLERDAGDYVNVRVNGGANGLIHIQRNLQRVLREGKQVHTFSTPKTATSDRKIIVGEKTLEALRTQQREVQLKKALAKNRWQENDLVFPSSTGTPLNQSNVLKQYGEIQKAAGLKHIRFHDLRHIAASIMLNHGIPLLTVSYILGHSQPSTTLNMYGHQFSAMELQAACLVDDIFDQPQPQPQPQTHPSSLPVEFLSVANLKK